MAIQKEITLQSDIVVPNAYHKVVATSMVRNGNDNRVYVQVSVFKDEAAKCAGKTPIMEFSLPEVSAENIQKFFSIDVLNAQGCNMIKQCYEYMKTQKVSDIDYTSSSLTV